LLEPGRYRFEGNVLVLLEKQKLAAAEPSSRPAPEDAEKQRAGLSSGSLIKELAATYSRASYTGTTIGNAAFDGRVRNGNGSDHSFMATKDYLSPWLLTSGPQPPETAAARKSY
jgi:hypothetical protein